MARWEVGDVEQLIETTLSDDPTIKTKMGIAPGGKARVANTVIPRNKGWLDLYIYFYCIPGPDTPGQGQTRIQSNPDYDIEVRTKGAPTQASEDIVDRIDELICAWNHQLTANGLWSVSVRRQRPINRKYDGETAEVYYIARGGTYHFQIVRA